MNLRLITIASSLLLVSFVSCKPSSRESLSSLNSVPVDVSLTTLVTTPQRFVSPESLPVSLLNEINANIPQFLADLEAVLLADTENLLVLVDKTHSLSRDYIPADLVSLDNSGSYQVSRDGFSLRSQAEKSLESMAAGALRDGLTLIVSSTYRSYTYQETVFERHVRELGETAAERESARPGTSQHQLGTAVDFGSITDAFAKTNAGRWLTNHANEYGWSLSFPLGYEDVTGYRWESWHYRYIGKEAAAFQKKWFGDVQQFMIEFIDLWKRETPDGFIS